jgi:hypothetical protein
MILDPDAYQTQSLQKRMDWIELERDKKEPKNLANRPSRVHELYLIVLFQFIFWDKVLQKFSIQLQLAGDDFS